MALSGLEDISFKRKEVKESLRGSIQTTKTLIFKHEANNGDLVIDTTALTAPADALGNGFIQDNPGALNLLINKRNLKIHSSRGVWLQMHEDFLVSSANTIQLIGNIADSGGALQDEVFTIYATPVQANTTITTDHKKQWQEYTLVDGETTLPLGREFEIRNTATSQIGSIRVFRTGYNGPLLRNVANATASPSADGDYEEVNVGNGFGNTLEFNVAPNGQDERVIVEFGLEYAGDFSMVGDIESLYGAVLKLADDVKELGPYDITRYLTANPSAVERRAFGDNVAGLLKKPKITTITAGSGSFIPTAGAKRIRVRAMGAGAGGGGTANAASSAGGGGGAGQYIEHWFDNLVASYAYQVGTGGPGGNTGGTSGTNGVSTTFGGLTAFGGNGGTGSGNSTLKAGGAGGSGVSGADFQATGGQGGNSMHDGAQGMGGLGGASFFGSGGYGGQNTHIAPSAGVAYGSGGGGGGANGGAQAGANGADGVIIIEEWF